MIFKFLRVRHPCLVKVHALVSFVVILKLEGRRVSLWAPDIGLLSQRSYVPGMFWLLVYGLDNDFLSTSVRDILINEMFLYKLLSRLP